MIGDKRFLPAALLLVKSSKTIAKPEIASIGAMSELKAYFASQETVSTGDVITDPRYLPISWWRSYTAIFTSRRSTANLGGSRTPRDNLPVRCDRGPS